MSFKKVFKVYLSSSGDSVSHGVKSSDIFFSFDKGHYYFHVNGSIGIVQKIDFEIRPDL